MEQFEQLLTCAICLDRYRNPKLLPCQHSFCMEPCMEGLVDYVRRQVKCPECRAEHRIPYQGIQGYPTNVTLQRFLELHIEITGEMPDPTSGQTMRRCAVCTEKSYCQHCAHCSKEVCPLCKSAHMDILRREISRINQQVRRSMGRLEDVLAVVEKNMTALEQNCGSVSEEIEEVYRRVSKALKDRAEYLRQEMSRYRTLELKNLTTLKENMQAEISNIESNCDLVDKHMQNEEVEWEDVELLDTKEIFLKTVDFLRHFEAEMGDYGRRVRFVTAHDPNTLVVQVANFADLNIHVPHQFIGIQAAGPGLARSKSDHRLTSYRQEEGRGAEDSGRVSPLGGRRFGDRARHLRHDYDDYEDTSRQSARSRIRSRLRQQNADTDSDEGGGGRTVRFEPPAVKTLDTEDVTKGPLSGIARLYDSARVMTRLLEAQTKRDRPPSPPPAVPPPQHVPPPSRTLTAAAQRQVSEEDEISKIKRQMKNAPGERPVEDRPAPERVSALRSRAEDPPRSPQTQAGSGASGEESDEPCSQPQSPQRKSSASSSPAGRPAPRPAEPHLGGRGTAGGGERKEEEESSSEEETDSEESSSEEEEKPTPVESRPTPTLQRKPKEETLTPPRRVTSEGEGRRPTSLTTKRDEDGGTSAPWRTRSQHSSREEDLPTPSRYGEGRSAGYGRQRPEKEESPTYQRSRPSYRDYETDDTPAPTRSGFTSRFLNKSKSSVAVSPEEEDPGPTRRFGSSSSPRTRYSSLKDRKARLARSKSSHALGDDEEEEEVASLSPSAYLASLSRCRSSHQVKSRETSPEAVRPSASSSASAATERDGAALSSWARYLKNKYGVRGKESGAGSSSSNSRRLSLGLPLRQEEDEQTKNSVASPTSPTQQAVPGIGVGSTTRCPYLTKRRQLLSVGSRGSEPGCFTWPRGVAVGPDDTIVVADSSNHRVQVFDSNGTFVKGFGQYGNGEGEFDCLAGVAVNRIGQYIIADRYNHRIQVMDPSGRFLRSFGSQGTSDGRFNYPWGVTTDALGFIYVVDKENHRVQVFQSDGTFVGKFGSQGRGPGQLDHPHYIAVSNTNKVVVSDSNNHRVQMFDVNGRLLSSFGQEGSDDGHFKFPRGVAVDDQGYILVGDSGNNRIQVFTAEGIFVRGFGSWGSGDGEFKGLEGLAVTHNNCVLACDRENHRIQVF